MAIAGYQGLWTGDAADHAGYSFLVNKNPIRNRIKRLVNRSSMKIVSELFDTLIGAAAGETAAANHTRVAAVNPFAPYGAIRTVETVTDINRASTAADITALKEMVFNVKTRPSYVRDLSGNGGPAYT